MYIMHTYFVDLLLKEAVLGRIKNYFKFLKHSSYCVIVLSFSCNWSWKLFTTKRSRCTVWLFHHFTASDAHLYCMYQVSNKNWFCTFDFRRAFFAVETKDSSFLPEYKTFWKKNVQQLFPYLVTDAFSLDTAFFKRHNLTNTKRRGDCITTSKAMELW